VSRRRREAKESKTGMTATSDLSQDYRTSQNGWNEFPRWTSRAVIRQITSGLFKKHIQIKLKV